MSQPTPSNSPNREYSELKELVLRLQESIDLLNHRRNDPLQSQERRCYSVDETATIIKRRAWTVRNYCNQGKILATKNNSGQWRIESSEVVHFQEHGPRPGKLLERSQDLGHVRRAAEMARDNTLRQRRQSSS